MNVLYQYEPISMKANFVGLQWNLYLYGSLNAVDMILSQEEREYIQLFKDMIVVLYADSDIEPLLTFCNQCITKKLKSFQVCQGTWKWCVKE